jgi:hypothetical protein
MHDLTTRRIVLRKPLSKRELTDGVSGESGRWRAIVREIAAELTTSNEVQLRWMINSATGARLRH